MSVMSGLRRSPPPPVKQTNLYVDVNYMHPKSMFIAEPMDQDEEEDTGEDTVLAKVTLRDAPTHRSRPVTIINTCSNHCFPTDFTNFFPS